MDRIELNNLTRTYYDAQGETFCALDHASLIWEQGHSIAIMGESGSGKSTLARLMIGLERPSEGRVLINGVDTTKWGLREWRKYTDACKSAHIIWQNDIDASDGKTDTLRADLQSHENYSQPALSFVIDNLKTKDKINCGFI